MAYLVKKKTLDITWFDAIECSSKQELRQILEWHTQKGNVWDTKEKPLDKFKTINNIKYPILVETSNYFGYYPIPGPKGFTVLSFSKFKELLK